MSERREGSFVERRVEKEKQPPLLIVYRENKEYQKYVPVVRRVLESLGRSVSIESFPEGTSEDQIKAWAEAHVDEMDGKDILSDETFGYSVPQETREDLDAKLAEEFGETKGFPGFLGWLFERAAKRSFLGDVVETDPTLGVELRHDRLKDLEGSKKAYVEMLQKILQEKGEPPKQVAIIAANILDHSPFEGKSVDEYLKEKGMSEEEAFDAKMMAENYGMTQAQFTEELVAGSMPKARRANREEVIDVLAPEEAERDRKVAVDFMKETLEEAGIDRNSIVVARDLTEANAKQLSVKDGWLIIDRHALGGKDSLLHDAKVLQLPIESFYESAQRAGLLTVNPEAMEKEIEFILKEYLGPKPKEKAE